ncbi:hypothetical protein DMH04_53545 [Kibdelosporangium aridum]|uniref:Condensation domain-containing protein n=2 Tax=Kibdelosporangium aridum TaxID=2030 RepID=A0A428Y2W9_KIBAR|nr:hypothetical protein DMH04_53545 [Kibdelosporangium aridum]
MTRSTVDRMPLTAGQQLVWLAQRLAPASPLYNAAECVEIHGQLDVSSFEHAVRVAVAEADALNVCVVEEQGRTTQVHRSATDWKFPVIDLSGDSDPLTAARGWMATDLAEPVDMTTEPLFGHALFVLGPGRHLWYHRCHHIALDGYGFFLVAQRVAQVYTAPDSAGRWFGALRSVVEADHAYQRSEQRELDSKFWQARYADHPPALSFTDRIAAPSGRILRRSALLPEDVATGLSQAARRGGVSWPKLVFAVVARQVHRRTGANEIVLGSCLMGRLGSLAARTPAMIANIVPVRVLVRAGDDLLTVARSVGQEMRAIKPHTRYRGEHVRRDLRLLGGERRLYGPVVNVLPFDYDLSFGSSRGFAKNLSTGPHGIEDIVINFHVRSNQPPELDLDANPRCYSEAGLEELLGELVTSLVHAARRP